NKITRQRYANSPGNGGIGWYFLIQQIRVSLVQKFRPLFGVRYSALTKKSFSNPYIRGRKIPSIDKPNMTRNVCNAKGDWLVGFDVRNSQLSPIFPHQYMVQMGVRVSLVNFELTVRKPRICSVI